jgi:hypothetical protein
LRRRCENSLVFGGTVRSGLQLVVFARIEEGSSRQYRTCNANREGQPPARSPPGGWIIGPAQRVLRRQRGEKSYTPVSRIKDTICASKRGVRRKASLGIASAASWGFRLAWPWQCGLRRSPRQPAARCHPPAARRPDLEIGSGAEMPVVPDAALFATGAHDQADDAARDNALLLVAPG